LQSSWLQQKAKQIMPFKPTNIANVAQNESSSFSVFAICSSCNEEGHSRRTSKRCRLYSRPGNFNSLEPVPIINASNSNEANEEPVISTEIQVKKSVNRCRSSS
jgi:hypothetical protein